MNHGGQTFGELFRQLREAAGMSLGEAARELRCNVTDVSACERGKGPPPSADALDLFYYVCFGLFCQSGSEAVGTFPSLEQVLAAANEEAMNWPDDACIDGRGEPPGFLVVTLIDPYPLTMGEAQKRRTVVVELTEEQKHLLWLTVTSDRPGRDHCERVECCHLQGSRP